jgi:hypothetical protein
MSKYIVKRNFDKSNGMAYVGTILYNIPEPYVTDWTALGLIAEYFGEVTDGIPASVTTSAASYEKKPVTPVLDVKKQTGKPPKKVVKK